MLHAFLFQSYAQQPQNSQEVHTKSGAHNAWQTRKKEIGKHFPPQLGFELQKIHEIVSCDPIWIRKNGAHQLKSAARQKKSQVPNAIGHPHFAANQVTTWSKHINPATHHMISMILLISCQISFTFLHIQNCPMEGVQHQPREQASNKCKSSQEIANRPEKARI